MPTRASRGRLSWAVRECQRAGDESRAHHAVGGALKGEFPTFTTTPPSLSSVLPLPSTTTKAKTLDLRLAVLEDLGENVPEISFEDFLDHLAPSQTKFDLDGTLKQLKADRVLSTTGQWTRFQNEPKNRTGGENGVFSALIDIFDKTVDAVIATSDPRKDRSSCTVDFVQNPTPAPESVDQAYGE